MGWCGLAWVDAVCQYGSGVGQRGLELGRCGLGVGQCWWVHVYLIISFIK